jgi:hypothetical protein
MGAITMNELGSLGSLGSLGWRWPWEPSAAEVRQAALEERVRRILARRELDRALARARDRRWLVQQVMDPSSAIARTVARRRRNMARAWASRHGPAARAERQRREDLAWAGAVTSGALRLRRTAEAPPPSPPPAPARQPVSLAIPNLLERVSTLYAPRAPVATQARSGRAVVTSATPHVSAGRVWTAGQ